MLKGLDAFGKVSDARERNKQLQVSLTPCSPLYHAYRRWRMLKSRRALEAFVRDSAFLEIRDVQQAHGSRFSTAYSHTLLLWLNLLAHGYRVR